MRAIPFLGSRVLTVYRKKHIINTGSFRNRKLVDDFSESEIKKKLFFSLNFK